VKVRHSKTGGAAKPQSLHSGPKKARIRYGIEIPTTWTIEGFNYAFAIADGHPSAKEMEGFSFVICFAVTTAASDF
jgi:hypothetical protein